MPEQGGRDREAPDETAPPADREAGCAQQGRGQDALPLARRMLELTPGDPALRALVRDLEREGPIPAAH